MVVTVGDFLMTRGKIFVENSSKVISDFSILEVTGYYDYNDTYEVRYKNKQGKCEEVIISKNDIITDCIRLKFEYIVDA